MTAADRLRARMAAPGVIVIPGVTNALHARLAQQAGFDAVFTTGAGIANASLAIPDLGLMTMSEIVEANNRIVHAIDVPVIADADTGYGNHLNVIRTTQELERAGVAALIIEDQLAPKRCGHFAGKDLVDTEEMVEKLLAAVHARQNPATMLVARTDAIAVEGMDAALERAHAYVAAGADIIFVEAPTSTEQLIAIPKEIAVPCLVNVVEGGATPLLAASELERMGFRLVLYANLALRVAAWSVAEAFAHVRREGSSSDILDRMMSWEARQALVDLGHWQDLDRELSERAQALLAARALASASHNGAGVLAAQSDGNGGSD
jgi:2-methylisocitrate lyase-like PEP mutase family enzyme